MDQCRRRRISSDGGRRRAGGRALVASPSSRAGGASRRFARRSLTRNRECHRARAPQAKPRIDRAARGPALDPRCARWPVRWRRDAERPFMMFDLALLGRRSNTEQPGRDVNSANAPSAPEQSPAACAWGFIDGNRALHPSRLVAEALNRTDRVAAPAVAWGLPRQVWSLASVSAFAPPRDCARRRRGP